MLLCCHQLGGVNTSLFWARSRPVTLTVVDEQVALQREGGPEQSLALLALEGSFLRVGLRREQSAVSVFTTSCRGKDPDGRSFSSD